jgi:hypothetical protein
LAEQPVVVSPDGELTYVEYMQLLAEAADDRDLGSIEGALHQTLQYFGPGGTPPIRGI